MDSTSELNSLFEKTSLIFFVNGKKIVELYPEPEQTLLSYLRDRLRLCGTKLGCGEGGCGACTVMLSKVDRRTNEIIHLSVNACLTPVCSVHGMAITTVEGIGSTKTKLHPVQERIAKAHGSQCGFCTPGIVMSMYTLLRSMPKPSLKDLDIAFQGNLCRCTGYRPILDGYRTFLGGSSENGCAMGIQCCKNGGSGCGDSPNLSKKLFEPSDFTPFDPTQEPIFPPELKLSDILDQKSVIFKGSRVTWYRPTNLKDLMLLKKRYPEAKIIVGNTEVGVEVKLKNFHYPILILPNQITELTQIEDTGYGLKIGASVTLDSMEKALQLQIINLPEHETRLFKSIVAMLHWFAGKQIRNTASVGGNIMTASPISDLNPIFTAAEIELEVQSTDRGLRKVYMGNDFFTSYRKNIIQSDEILLNIFIPRTKSDQYFVAYKQAKRRDDDIAIVTAAFNVIFQENTDIVKIVQMSFGGMAPTTVLASKSAEKMIGKKWSKELIEEVNGCLVEELDLSPSAPGGMVMYRKSLTLSLFFKTYLKISQQLEKTLNNRVPIPTNEKSGAATFHTLPPKTSQLYEIQTVASKYDKVGAPEVHSSAFKQATGEAVYCDDMPKIENELYLGFVLSTKAHAKILSIDATEALKLEGVQAFYSGEDIQDKNNYVGAVFHDEQVFAKNVVICQGQTLGVIVADNQTLAQRASRLVKVSYEEISPVIITIEDAIKNNSYFPGYPKVMTSGDPVLAFKNADHIYEGECRMGGQEHFYLETQVAYAIPKEGDELEIFSSSQHPTEIQNLASHVLGIPAAKVVVRVKRIGGGFGGKETRSSMVALPAAFAAYHLKKPVRCMLDRDEDMIMTGTRHPFLFKYKIAFTKDGIITGCEVDMYNNGGCSMDLSFSVLDRAMYHFTNSYFIKNCLVRGWVCRTNLASNTAFRGFGAPQGMLVGEHIVRDIARITGKDVVQIATMNMMREGQITHYQQKIENCNVSRCWDQCITSSEFYRRRQLVNEFNKQNRWRKRGISMVPTTFGIAFGVLHLNQGGALVHVYIDGSVLVSHGGTEMGQGLHTKMIQVASKTLNIPIEKIHISETSTDKVPNTSATAASVSSDINGMAVMYACQAILERIKPYQDKYPEEDWNAWINRAYFERVSLSATGFYATPNVVNEDPKGNYYNYFTYGAACSEVEIDCLTGDHQVLRTDIVMDVGSSINPAIDIGQIEGGFMQGYGLFTLEELIYSPAGQLYSKGPGMYKIPGFSDIPAELNVSLLTGAPNPRAIYSSKAIGEPPLFLASSIFFAIKEAINAARTEENLPLDYDFKSPATSERIRMACQDKITKKITEPKADTFIPWNIMV